MVLLLISSSSLGMICIRQCGRALWVASFFWSLEYCNKVSYRNRSAHRPYYRQHQTLHTREIRHPPCSTLILVGTASRGHTSLAGAASRGGSSTSSIVFICLFTIHLPVPIWPWVTCWFWRNEASQTYGRTVHKLERGGSRYRDGGVLKSWWLLEKRVWRVRRLVACCAVGAIVTDL